MISRLFKGCGVCKPRLVLRYRWHFKTFQDQDCDSLFEDQGNIFRSISRALFQGFLLSAIKPPHFFAAALFIKKSTCPLFITKDQVKPHPLIHYQDKDFFSSSFSRSTSKPKTNTTSPPPPTHFILYNKLCKIKYKYIPLLQKGYRVLKWNGDVYIYYLLLQSLVESKVGVGVGSISCFYFILQRGEIVFDGVSVGSVF